ncbi:MAG TPA: DUF1622 domain-containing protein [Gemmatimonadaceae bacterium]|jgi:uncharacterized membrane protein
MITRRVGLAESGRKANGERHRFTALRLDFARYLALALELRLASDVLQTALSPTWDQLGILGAIATIRTALNFFLAREMRDELSISEEPASDRLIEAGTME